MKISIPIVTRVNDNQDGGYSIFCYNTEEEMLRDHPKSQKFNTKTEEYDIIELTTEEKEEILSGEDEYENGYIDRANIHIEVDLHDKTAKLTKTISFSAGQ